MERICPEVLVISSKHDYSTDHIVYHLKRKGVPYLRLNRDQLSEFKIGLLPVEQRLFGEAEDFSFEITAKVLKSIYFRAPSYLRDNYQPSLTPDEQLSRNQWASFIRSLIIFDKVLWVNNPHATYRAEIKPYQLYVAKKVGFDVPETIITNVAHNFRILGEATRTLAVKTLDPTILKIELQEAFVYTNIVDSDELAGEDLSTAPVVIQRAIIPKTDARVTVVGEYIFAVDIKKDGHGIDRDWRLEKENVQYSIIDLPTVIRQRCILLMRALELTFGAIDLAMANGRYYFLEINPTGEWGWLLEHTGLKIDEKIVELLLENR